MWCDEEGDSNEVDADNDVNADNDVDDDEDEDGNAINVNVDGKMENGCTNEKVSQPSFHSCPNTVRCSGSPRTQTSSSRGLKDSKIITQSTIWSIIFSIQFAIVIIPIPTNVPFLLLVLWHHVKGKPLCLQASMQASP